ncbi:MAG: ribonuclease P protein component [bacterium]|nr:ribonuclease P protein component [bacterium]
MKKQNIVKESRDFSRIISKKNGVVNNHFIINTELNNDNIVKFGITFKHNLCNAVSRNKLKRQVKSILDNNKNIYEKNKNYIIIIREGALSLNYLEKEKELVSLFNRLKEKQNEENK